MLILSIHFNLEKNLSMNNSSNIYVCQSINTVLKFMKVLMPIDVLNVIKLLKC